MDEVGIMIIEEDKDFERRFVQYLVNDCKNISIHKIDGKEMATIANEDLVELLNKCQVVIASESYCDMLVKFKNNFMLIVMTESPCVHLKKSEKSKDIFINIKMPRS